MLFLQPAVDLMDCPEYAPRGACSEENDREGRERKRRDKAGATKQGGFFGRNRPAENLLRA
jgi:hypothetical protein